MHSPLFYFEELMFEYDCVTIPGFGGFVMQSLPAKIDKVKHRIYPPARVPSFNSMLSHDDGLLSSRMAKDGNISYEDAAKLVQEFASELKNCIVRGENVILEGIGELRKGPEGKINFTPAVDANFQTSSFGLEPLNLYPVSKEPVKERTVRKPVDRKPAEFREKRPASVRWTVTVAIPVILFLLYGIIFPGSFQKVYTSYSGILVDIFHRQKAEPAVVQVKPEVSAEPLTILEPERKIAAAPVIVKEVPVTVVPEVKKETVKKAEPVVKPSTQKYYIIGGCFELEENAAKFMKQLKKKGYDPEEAGANKHGHVRISYKSFTDKQEAITFMDQIKKDENPSAWLLKY
jgi:hypothetical protein